ncbi:hypothetical protein [Dactylosporangium matsuzakiense]|uniref:Uncharacterized protein n=1 Tax=Dactylosporangium matsuzakiense TaxID=53360 RepID=A0A9W6NJK9_9ACTN|nr:hypothetical protein [Dactylosporangium matsuzakiense]GLK99368.1 hypothetical protein GCM10017581_011090 [Dactylosporangium matsuzakiense]
MAEPGRDVVPGRAEQYGRQWGVAGHGVAAAIELVFRLYPVLLPRPRTDGSLLDAMRAATVTMSDPKGLTDIEGTLARHGYVQPGASAVDPRWEPVLNQLDDDALRRHLGGLCLNAHLS